MSEPLVLGAVAYDPKVVTIWDGFLAYFKARGLPFDYVLYENYERQVLAQLAGEIDVAWNSPLAWLEAERGARALGLRARAVAMRDSDRDLTSVVVTRADGPVRELADLRGRRVGVGAADSPQATLLPRLHLAEAGLEAGRDYQEQRHDLLLGKHGDHIGGEREAVRALVRGEIDAACILDGNLGLFVKEGTALPGALRVLSQTAPYDHCNFTVVDGAAGPGAHRIGRFVELLVAMSYEDPAVRPLLDLEGLKAWLPGRVEGYAALARAAERFDAYRDFDPRLAGRRRPQA